ncbi:protein GL2-INTERACTING REPRESSOR 1-like [Lycium barbarum]|uniref:protein GL2-INTERACTING REPRESSOR 1-like n=1 Tax=Lycium barbarum TaxID=112863 RepID=UPI00293EB384|nr:protein GL2-INTERACTING REPRESSOR 1-like [Lycium barbarum]
MNYTKESHAKLDLKLNLSPARGEPSSPRRSSSSSSSSSLEIVRSPVSSCVSREPSPCDDPPYSGYPSSPDAAPMMLVGCPRCLMYVMLSVNEPKCPKCKSTVLLDFFHEERIKNSK